MAEVVAVVASSAGIAGIAYQIFESVYKLQQVLTAIKDAPHQLKTILDEISIVTNVLVQCSETPRTHSIGAPQVVPRDQALLHCEQACRQLLAIVSEIDKGVRGSTCRSRWYSVLAVLKAKKIAELVTRLESAKSTLALAQLMYLQSLELERRSQTGSSSLTPAARGPQSLNSRSATLQNGVEKAGASHSETTLQLGIGVLVVRHIHTTSGEDDSPLDETRVQFRFAHWFLSWGVMIAVGRDFGKFKITIRPHRLVRGDAPIFQACALGDDQAVAQLIQEGRASPFDTTSEGVTPLLVAAAWLHPSTTKQLLQHGADESVSINYCDIYWNALGLAVERAGYYRSFLFPELENLRAEPQECLARMRDTMRVLTEHGNVEVHDGYTAGETGSKNRSRSALHGFRGSSEDFLWLIGQDNGFMSARDWDDYVASIVLQQTEMFPNDCFPAAFSQVSDIKYLAKYKDSSGSTLLHYLLDTNFGHKPGNWMNGLDVFTFVRTLLEQGADPSARNRWGNTPLMRFARHLSRSVWACDSCCSASAMAEHYSDFFVRWTHVLKSCGIDLGEYRAREVESGAERFSPGQNGTMRWMVRLVFAQDEVDMPQELQINLEFQIEGGMMPGAWPCE